MNRLPSGWKICAPWTDPKTGEPVVIVDAGGIPLAWHTGGEIGAVAWNWRDTPPDACGLAVARALADHLRASQVRDEEEAAP
jgi:hypothetical protein